MSCKCCRFLCGVIVGSAVGAAIGFLANDEIRGKVQKGVEDTTNVLKDQAEVYADRIKTQYQYAEDALRDRVELWKSAFEEKIKSFDKDDLEADLFDFDAVDDEVDAEAPAEEEKEAAAEAEAPAEEVKEEVAEAEEKPEEAPAEEEKPEVEAE